MNLHCERSCLPLLLPIPAVMVLGFFFFFEGECYRLSGRLAPCLLLLLAHRRGGRRVNGPFPSFFPPPPLSLCVRLSSSSEAKVLLALSVIYTYMYICTPFFPPLCMRVFPALPPPSLISAT
jgi:hypothetical protein